VQQPITVEPFSRTLRLQFPRKAALMP